MKKKPTDEQLEQIIAETTLNRKERRLLKYKKAAMQDTLTMNTRPGMQNLAGTNVVKNLTSKGN